MLSKLDESEFLVNFLKSIDKKRSSKSKMPNKPSEVAVQLIWYWFIFTVIIQIPYLIVTFACYIVPGYHSYKSLESGDVKKVTKYLTYWIVLSLVELLFMALTSVFDAYFIFALIRAFLTLVLLHPRT